MTEIELLGNPEELDDADVKAREIRRDYVDVWGDMPSYRAAQLAEAIAAALRDARQQERAACAEAVRKPFLTVFLDGRNGYGSHVLPMPGDSIGNDRHLLDIQSFLENQDEGLAEKIISEAEALGFEVGQCVVTIWRHTDTHDMPGNDYFEYACISESLTALFCGTAAEQQREAIEARATGEVE